MNSSITRFTLDLQKQDSMEYVAVRKGDTKRGVCVMLTESGTPYSITAGTNAVLAAQKPDGAFIYESCTVEDNRITAVLPSSFTAAAGKLRACIRLTGSEAAITSPPFTIIVDEPAAPAQT